MLVDILEDVERTKAEDFFDVGCHIGYYACHVGMAFPFTKVHGFDINPTACHETAANLLLNGINGHVVCAAAAEAPGGFRAMIEYKVARPATMRAIEPKESTVIPFRAPTIGLGMYAHQCGANPRVVKMDIEGSEEEAVLGLIPAIRGNDARAVYVEIHARDDDRLLHRVVNLIEDHRFVSHRYEVEGAEQWRFRR
jgi:FkbM family methyltransferase